MTHFARIGAGRITVDVDAQAGGRLAQILVDGTPLLVGRDDVAGDALMWGAFPMVPWAGRIRDGTFEFAGTRYQLPRNHGPHAMHGVGFTSPWTITERTATRVALHLDLPADERWQFGGHVDQVIGLAADVMTCTMTVGADARAFPVSFGWHPWFRKPERLDFRPYAMYRRDDRDITVDELVPVPDGPWDDCFVNHRPVGLRIDGVDVVLESACTHWVVYDEPDDSTCVEPQTAPPDAFTIAPRVLDAGESATASFRLVVSTPR